MHDFDVLERFVRGGLRERSGPDRRGMRVASRRVLTLSLLSVVLVLSVAGCGGSDPEPSPSPSTTASKTPSATPTTASPSPSASPLSEFEDDPAVQAVRAWARAYATDVNTAGASGDDSFAQSAAVTTKAGLVATKQSGHDDLERKVLYAGPLPLTPVQVRGSASQSSIDVCALAEGWARDRATGKVAAKRQVIGARFAMTKSSNGTWRVAAINSFDTIKCDGVKVAKVRF